MHLIKYRFDENNDYRGYDNKSRELCEWVTNLGRPFSQQKYDWKDLPDDLRERIVNLDPWFDTQFLSTVMRSVAEGWEIICVRSIDPPPVVSKDDPEGDHYDDIRCISYTYLVLIDDLLEATELKLLYG
jgi:hypothetical protein